MIRSIFFRTRLFSSAVTTMRSFEASSSAALSLPRTSGAGLWIDSTVSTSVLLMSADARWGFAMMEEMQRKLETAVEKRMVELIVRLIHRPHGEFHYPRTPLFSDPRGDTAEVTEESRCARPELGKEGEARASEHQLLADDAEGHGRRRIIYYRSLSHKV
jgi:hypothetical protein